MSSLSLLATIISLLGMGTSVASSTSPASVASLYSLATSTSLPFPTATLASSDAGAFMVSQWSLSKGHVQEGVQDLAFVADPFPNAPVPIGPQNTSTEPVLRATYPAGSFNNESVGGAQFYSMWNTTDAPFETMMLSYEIAFDAGFDWVKGGKLPGLRGGPNALGCSGGDKPDGTDCFSTRLMWRKNGDGEVYAYIPTPNGLCDASGIICNTDFGTSIRRGAYSFPSGQWSRITMVVRLNNPPDVANGFVGLYFNDVQAISQGDLQLRSGAGVHTNGLFFSTFFGGGDPSWATPVEAHSYYRNFQLWAGSAPSNLTGSKVSGSSRAIHISEWGTIALTVAAFFGACSVGFV